MAIIFTKIHFGHTDCLPTWPVTLRCHSEVTHAPSWGSQTFERSERAEEDKTTWTVNPLAESVQMQEDWIGRPSRLSRRVCPKLIHRRVCQRSLISVMQYLKRADKDQRGLFGVPPD